MDTPTKAINIASIVLGIIVGLGTGWYVPFFPRCFISKTELLLGLCTISCKRRLKTRPVSRNIEMILQQGFWRTSTREHPCYVISLHPARTKSPDRSPPSLVQSPAYKGGDHQEDKYIDTLHIWYLFECPASKSSIDAFCISPTVGRIIVPLSVSNRASTIFNNYAGITTQRSRRVGRPKCINASRTAAALPGPAEYLLR